MKSDPGRRPTDILRSHGLHAKKEWGQNFLGDESVLEDLARLAGAQKGDTIVEFGAGLGHYTRAGGHGRARDRGGARPRGSVMTAASDAEVLVSLVGLVDGDPDGRVTTAALRDRAESADGDAPLAALALAQRGDDAEDAKVTALLAARDPILRAHVARGLAASTYKDVVGRLGNAFAYESDVGVRRAIVTALAARIGSDAAAPLRLETLRIAARFDPDRVVRGAASRALAGLPATPYTRARVESEVLWLRVAAADGQPAPHDVTASLYRSDGLAVPVVFDDDGYAIVPGSPPGEARLVLAPRLPVYHAPAP